MKHLTEHALKVITAVDGFTISHSHINLKKVFIKICFICLVDNNSVLQCAGFLQISVIMLKVKYNFETQNVWKPIPTIKSLVLTP